MNESVEMAPLEIAHRTRAIVCFGPATPTTGSHGGEYFQVVIDPAMQSPSGDYIRFDLVRPSAETETCEINGWQRIAALTICEVLATLEPSEEKITMRAIVKD